MLMLSLLLFDPLVSGHGKPLCLAAAALPGSPASSSFPWAGDDGRRRPPYYVRVSFSSFFQTHTHISLLILFSLCVSIAFPPRHRANLLIIIEEIQSANAANGHNRKEKWWRRRRRVSSQTETYRKKNKTNKKRYKVATTTDTRYSRRIKSSQLDLWLPLPPYIIRIMDLTNYLFLPICVYLRRWIILLLFYLVAAIFVSHP